MSPLCVTWCLAFSSRSSLPSDAVAQGAIRPIPAVSSQSILADVRVKALAAVPTATAVVIPTGLRHNLSKVVILIL